MNQYEERCLEEIPDMYEKTDFNHLNIIEGYYYNMNNVDIAYQLRRYYMFDYCMHKRKLWWSIVLLPSNASDKIVNYL